VERLKHKYNVALSQQRYRCLRWKKIEAIKRETQAKNQSDKAFNAGQKVKR
jgi:hypothetical protein